TESASGAIARIVSRATSPPGCRVSTNRPRATGTIPADDASNQGASARYPGTGPWGPVWSEQVETARLPTSSHRVRRPRAWRANGTRAGRGLEAVGGMGVGSLGLQSAP